MKIGYVGLLKAMYESAEGKNTLEYLQKEASKREKEVGDKRDELLGLRTEIEEKSSVWNQDTRAAKIQAFQMKEDELRRLAQRHTQEFNKQKQENEGRIEEELRATVTEVAKKKGYTHIFDTTLNVLLVMPAADDITDDVIKAYDKKKKK
jgi:Skp family chaperone for outer membrane proteins